MDYVVGSVAALISGNVTPNRPKPLKRALTPMKHQPSPNVTPKSELVSDRSIFLSPTTQKKKAIVKKSPKRIFQNPDLDVTNENDGNLSLTSPKADKVKKHLKNELDSNIDTGQTILSPKSPKNKLNKSIESPSSKKRNISETLEITQNVEEKNEKTPKKKKKKLNVESEMDVTDIEKDKTTNVQDTSDSSLKVEPLVEKNTPKKKKKMKQGAVEITDTDTTLCENEEPTVDTNPKKSKKNKKKSKHVDGDQDKSVEVDINASGNKENEVHSQQKKKRKKKSSKNKTSNLETAGDIDTVAKPQPQISEEVEQVNPNAITNQETDSEHESDDDIESENEENNKSVLDTGPGASSDDEEDEKEDTKKQKKTVDIEHVNERVESEDEVKRTLFVGNVPFSSKCKKEIKKIFSKYGSIETVRIRTVPVKDARVTPKLAVIKNELHPERSTVNVYIKYKEPSSVNEALVENNTVLNDHHLRVGRSDVTGSEHDPKCSVFVGNIPFALEDEGLRAKFEKCGEIVSVRIIRDRKTNAGKGFGYVNFASKDGVELALALTEEDLTMKNRILRVKRCTQPTANKQRNQQNNQMNQQNNQTRQQNYQRGQQSYQGRQQNYQGRQQNLRGRQENYQGRQQSFQGRQQNYQAGQQNYQGRQQDYQGRPQDNQRGTNNRGNFQMNRSGTKQFGNDRFQRRDHGSEVGKNEGAYKRIMDKRKSEESKDGPPSKMQKNINQPAKEKKTKKEFVGITAEKKKLQKRKLNKDQKKKKALSEILTKGSL